MDGSHPRLVVSRGWWTLYGDILIGHRQRFNEPNVAIDVHDSDDNDSLHFHDIYWLITSTTLPTDNFASNLSMPTPTRCYRKEAPEHGPPLFQHGNLVFQGLCSISFITDCYIYSDVAA